MPNRIIKESICTSDNLDGLSWFEEVFFYRLIVNCDDYGRTDARPSILRARLFPLKSVTDQQIERALQSLRSADMIDIYVVNGRSYLQMRTWGKHQSIRAKKSKYPAPENVFFQDETCCNHLNSNEFKCSRNPIQSESNPNPNPNPNICTTPDIADVVLTLPLNDRTEYPILKTQAEEWKELFPSVDVEQELRNMKAWCIANPARLKTKKGILRFITRWLSKEQDRGKTVPNSRKYVTAAEYKPPLANVTIDDLKKIHDLI